MTYRAGIIGCGSIAAAHARGYQGAPGVELVAAADPLERARDALRERFGIPRAYADAEEMLRVEELDLVSICLWHPLHAPFTLLAAPYRPKAILCEKPMATCLREADEMIAACEARGVKLAIGHQRRFNRSWTRARELLAEGVIGTPLMVTVETGDGLLNCGTHVVDATRYLLGDPETEWVMGAVERNSDRWERDVRIEDRCMGVIGFRGGVQALVQCDLTGTNNVENYSVRGTDGLLEVKQREVRLLRSAAAGWEVIETGYDDPWIEQARALVDWVKGNTATHRGAALQARTTLEILMGIYQSARERGVVRMPLAERENPLDRMVDAGELPVREPGRYDIRAFLTFEPAERERYAELRRQGLHPRDALAAMGRS
jgi:UDP-N-acetyl-2-amino-2-deoxyglucuronate dehydrogenase